MELFKQRLQILLDEKNINQKELAKMSGVTEVTISRYMTGSRKPRIEIANKIAQVLGTTTDYLLGNSDIRNPYNEDSKEKYPKSTELIEYVIEEAGKQGYNLKDKSKEELAEIIVKALKIDEITKSN